jgi:hypothetical protein
MPFEKDQETQVEIDMDAAQADISSELFGQGDDEESDDQKPAGEEDDDSGEATPTVEETSSPQPDAEKQPEVVPPTEGDNSAEVQAAGAPKTWNKEELATWATVPKEIQDKLTPILERREQDFFNGISQYKGMAERGQAYESVVEPYRPILAAENIDPVGLFQSFSANHYILSRGTEEQKVELAARMLEGYNIPLQGLLEYIAEGGGQQIKDPQYQQLEQRFNELNNRLSAEDTRRAEEQRTRISQEIETFASAKDDKGAPLHPYFDEVAQDIQQLFAAGAAKTLEEAYDKAVYANPTTRQKEIDRLTAERTSSLTSQSEQRRKKVADSTADNVTTTSKPRDGTVPKGSIDDTLQETMAAIEARG